MKSGGKRYFANGESEIAQERNRCLEAHEGHPVNEFDASHLLESLTQVTRVHIHRLSNLPEGQLLVHMLTNKELRLTNLGRLGSGRAYCVKEFPKRTINKLC